MVNYYHFPRLRFVAKTTLLDQLVKITSELQEVIDTIERGEPITRTAEELGDLATASMTALYIIERDHGIHPLDVIERVNVKNYNRGYGP